ncbi:MAG: hypothetical protein LBT91_00825 [Bifidobacteriaceae bacterium]|jgi:hypothetical protein|nr:hypothetical protein [Bifidobacteriaceae bacterium]
MLFLSIIFLFFGYAASPAGPLPNSFCAASFIFLGIIFLIIWLIQKFAKEDRYCNICGTFIGRKWCNDGMVWTYYQCIRIENRKNYFEQNT